MPVPVRGVDAVHCEHVEVYVEIDAAETLESHRDFTPLQAGPNREGMLAGCVDELPVIEAGPSSRLVSSGGPGNPTSGSLFRVEESGRVPNRRAAGRVPLELKVRLRERKPATLESPKPDLSGLGRASSRRLRTPKRRDSDRGEFGPRWLVSAYAERGLAKLDGTVSTAREWLRVIESRRRSGSLTGVPGNSRAYSAAQSKVSNQCNSATRAGGRTTQ